VTLTSMNLLRASFVLVSVDAYMTTTWQDLERRPHYSFQDYMQEFSKSYASFDEHVKREFAFATNLKTIQAHNSDPTATYKMGLNDFTDLTAEEFKDKMRGLNKAAHLTHDETPELVESLGLSMSDLPESVDWRTKTPAVVTAVKNQGACGSCWAFSATETIESAVAIATGKLLDLSEEQIVDCSPNPDHCGGSGGCKGSTQPLAFNYTLSNPITTSESYPYGKLLHGKCKQEKIQPAAGITGYKLVPKNNYTELAAAVATIGPIAISAAAGPWQLYESGVFSKNCGYTMDHGIQLVGYGAEGSQMYWTVRNSWGPGWGEKGYIRIARYGEGKEPCGTDKKPASGDACKGDKEPVQVCGECAILCSSSYPTGAHVV